MVTARVNSFVHNKLRLLPVDSTVETSTHAGPAISQSEHFITRLRNILYQQPPTEKRSKFCLMFQIWLLTRGVEAMSYRSM